VGVATEPSWWTVIVNDVAGFSARAPTDDGWADAVAEEGGAAVAFVAEASTPRASAPAANRAVGRMVCIQAPELKTMLTRPAT